jgi:hypothetical protein
MEKEEEFPGVRNAYYSKEVKMKPCRELWE